MYRAKIAQFKPVFKNIAWLLAERVTQVGLALIIGGLIARGFGPELYGKWQYAISLLFLAATLTYLCGAEVIAPKLVQHSEDTGTILGSAFFIRSIISIIGFVFGQLVVFLWIKDAEVAVFIRLLLILLLFNEPFNVVVTWFQSRTYIAPVVKIRLIALVIKAVLVISIILTAWPAWMVAGAWVTEGVLVMIMLMIIYKKTANQKWSVSYLLVRSYLKEGAVYWVGLLFMSLFMRLDRLFLAEYVGFDGLGVYSAAIQISENWFVLAVILSQSIAPKHIYADLAPEKINNNLRIFLVSYVSLAFVGSVIVAVLAPFIISVIFGESYTGSVEILQHTIFLSIVVFIDSLFNTLMLKEKAALWVGIKWSLALASALLINYLYIKEIGWLAPVLGLYMGYSMASIVGFIHWMHWKKKHRIGRLSEIY